MTYIEKLKDPRWQKVRLEILLRDGFSCRECDSKIATLHVHHTYYEKNKDPWDYPPESLWTLCDDCHQKRHAVEHQIRVMMGTLNLADLDAIICDAFWFVGNFNAKELTLALNEAKKKLLGK